MNPTTRTRHARRVRRRRLIALTLSGTVAASTLTAAATAAATAEYNPALSC